MFDLYINTEALNFGNLFKRGYRNLIEVARNKKDLEQSELDRFISLFSTYNKHIQQANCNYWELSDLLNSKAMEGTNIHINQDSTEVLNELIKSPEMQKSSYFKVDIQIYFTLIEKDNNCYINVYDFHENLITRKK